MAGGLDFSAPFTKTLRGDGLLARCGGWGLAANPGGC
jgi:hypothetical protein